MKKEVSIRNIDRKSKNVLGFSIGDLLEQLFDHKKHQKFCRAADPGISIDFWDKGK